jgi:hypothetical protein
MTRIPMSPAASALLRCLMARARVPRDRILLTDVISVGWRSLTFTGERHHFELRVTGPDSGMAVERMCHGLEDADFSIPGLIVADVAPTSTSARARDGSTTITIEALTIAAD